MQAYFDNVLIGTFADETKAVDALVRKALDEKVQPPFFVMGSADEARLRFWAGGQVVGEVVDENKGENDE